MSLENHASKVKFLSEADGWKEKVTPFTLRDPSIKRKTSTLSSFTGKRLLDHQ